MGLIHHKNLSFNHRKELILLSPECKKFFYLFCVGLNQLIALIVFFRL